MAEILFDPVPGFVTLEKPTDPTGQIEIKDGMLKRLESFVADGNDYIYDLEPQSNNLFYAGFFREGNETKSGLQLRPFYNAAYRIQKLSINLPKLTFEFNKYTHVPQMSQHMADLEVTIDWREDVYHSVKRYHLDWVQRWYNRAFDVLRCGPEGKFRRMLVVAFHYVNVVEKYSSVIEVPGIQPIFVIDICGMVPEDIGDFSFDYGADGNDSPVSCKYKASYANWMYTTQVAANEKTRDGLWNADSAAPGAQDQLVWNPINFAQDVYGERTDDMANLERLRIARNTTSFMVSNTNIG